MNYVNLNTFISKVELQDLIDYSKNSSMIQKLRAVLSSDDFKKFMNDFYKKLAYEYRPVAQISNSWLEGKFGFKGDIKVNTSTHGADAIYISKNKKKIINIELKHVSTMSTDIDSNGDQIKSQYHNGYEYWDINKKTWKFRKPADEFIDDYSFLMISDSMSDQLIEIIVLDNAETKTLLADKITAKFDRGSNPIALSYTHVKHLSHMIGNKLPVDQDELLFQTAFDSGRVFRYSKRGNWFARGRKLSLGKSRAPVIEWLKKN